MRLISVTFFFLLALERVHVADEILEERAEMQQALLVRIHSFVYLRILPNLEYGSTPTAATTSIIQRARDTTASGFRFRRWRCGRSSTATTTELFRFLNDRLIRWHRIGQRQELTLHVVHLVLEKSQSLGVV